MICRDEKILTILNRWREEVMYFLLVFLAAGCLFSLITTQWPVKIYHHVLLKKLGLLLHSEPQGKGPALSGLYSQIITIYRGRELAIRFLENSTGALQNQGGLEIRVKAFSPAVISIYQRKHNQREWGDFKQFQTGDPVLDSQWFILTDNPQGAAEFWGFVKFAPLLTGRHDLEQIQVNRDEIVVCLGRFHSPEKVVAFIDRLCGALAGR